jgi:hypothetical protein
MFHGTKNPPHLSGMASGGFLFKCFKLLWTCNVNWRWTSFFFLITYVVGVELGILGRRCWELNLSRQCIFLFRVTAYSNVFVSSPSPTYHGILNLICYVIGIIFLNQCEWN